VSHKCQILDFWAFFAVCNARVASVMQGRQAGVMSGRQAKKSPDLQQVGQGKG